jgi:hypothetical protein
MVTPTTPMPASAMAMKWANIARENRRTRFRGRELAKLAKKNLVTQMGTQIHAQDNYRRAVEIIQAGVLGPITEVLTWCPREWSGGKRPTENPPCKKQFIHEPHRVF